MTLHPILIAGGWRPSAATDKTFQAENPATGDKLPARFPVSNYADVSEALDAATLAAEELRGRPPSQIAEFLECYAARLEADGEAVIAAANLETGLPVSPRLAGAEMPRTVSQLRQAAKAAADGSWAHATIDTAAGIRSCFAALGPVAVFGPNNFPLAFNSVCGGDFAAAIAAGNPVIGKANSSHPNTTRLLAEHALAAVKESGLPDATVQLLYRLRHEDGEKMVADPRLGATGYTGGRAAGLALKAAADAAGKPFYAELSSINPVVILPGALRERGDALVDEFCTSCLMGAGQFCTNPGLLLLLDDSPGQRFVEQVAAKFQQQPAGVLLSRGVRDNLLASLRSLREAGAESLAGGQAIDGPGYRVANCLLRVSAARFLEQPELFQTEAFGNASLIVAAKDLSQVGDVLRTLEGNLTGCAYTSTSGGDDQAYDQLEPLLRRKVGRLLNDKMPTGVAVSAAMNHGGPFPATSHPGFTAVGIPASMTRFAMLECYDNVRAHRLPPLLRDKNPTGRAWRLIDGAWTLADAGAGKAEG